MKRVTGIGGIFFKAKDPKGIGCLVQATPWNTCRSHRAEQWRHQTR